MLGGLPIVEPSTVPYIPRGNLKLKLKLFTACMTLLVEWRMPRHAAEHFMEQVVGFTNIHDFDQQTVIDVMNNTVCVRRMEVEKLGKVSKVNPKGLQMMCGENFAEMWGFKNLEALRGMLRRRLMLYSQWIALR